MPLPDTLQRFRKLDFRQRAWLIVFMSVLPAIKVTLRMRGFARTREMVERWSQRSNRRKPT